MKFVTLSMKQRSIATNKMNDKKEKNLAFNMCLPPRYCFWPQNMCSTTIDPHEYYI